MKSIWREHCFESELLISLAAAQSDAHCIARLYAC
jgi:hypothetical protein